MIRAKEDWLYGAALVYTACIYGSMAVMSIGAALVFVAWVATRFGRLRTDLEAIGGTPLLVPSFVLGAACVWSLIWAKMSGLSFMGLRPEIDWVADTRKLWHLYFPFVLAAVFSSLSERRLRRLMRFWFVSSLAVSVLAIFQHYFPLYKPMILPGFENRYHATGLAGFHLSFASILAFPLAVATAFLAARVREGGGARIALALAALALVFVANTLTFSKIAWLAAPVAVALIAVVDFKGKARYAIMVALIAFGAVWGTSSSVKTRFAGINTIRDRLVVWRVNLQMIEQFPVFGVGWQQNAELSERGAVYVNEGEGIVRHFASHAHNNLIDQWATTGLFGFLAFLWWNIAAAVMNYRVYSRGREPFWRVVGLGFMAGWLCFHLNGLTQSNFWDAKVMHQTAWVVALTIVTYRRHAASG